MQISFPVATLVLAFGALATPVPADVAERSTVSGSNTNGSIFQFGSASSCKQIFWQSGACGLSTYFNGKVDRSLPLVAIPSHVFDKYGQAQNNKLCGKVITMTHNGVTKRAVVADENTSNEQSIDMCLDMWKAFGGHDNDGTLIKGFKWSIA